MELEDELCGFFPEIHGVDRHQQKSADSAPTNHLSGHRNIRRPEKRPQYEKQAHQEGERDKNDVEGFERHGDDRLGLEWQAEIKTIEVNRIAFG